MHWEVPETALRPLVPPALAIDTYEGKAYVGVVAFTMHDVRPSRFLPPIAGADTPLRAFTRSVACLRHGGART